MPDSFSFSDQIQSFYEQCDEANTSTTTATPRRNGRKARMTTRGMYGQEGPQKTGACVVI